MSKRREKRITMPLSVRIWGLDSEGRVFSQNAKTLDITARGARIYGVKATLEPGFNVGLQCGELKGRFMVAWVGRQGTSHEGQIGLRAVESGIWGIALPNAPDDEFGAWFEQQYLSDSKI
jgi:hypothetical protein